MRKSKTIGFSLALVATSGLFILLEGWTKWEFFWHLAAIPLEILIAVFIVEQLLEHREMQAKREQLMYIKSFMFRSQMRDLFIANFAALKCPALTMKQIRRASLAELREMRRQADAIEYRSLEALEPIIDEYVKAEPVWHSFKERAITYNFENIFLNMMGILHFIYDVRSFKAKHPQAKFVHEAAKKEEAMKKVWKIVTDGIRLFLDYAIELKEKQPVIFDEMMADYELSIRLRESA
jgi:hypothetical protein